MVLRLIKPIYMYMVFNLFIVGYDRGLCHVQYATSTSTHCTCTLLMEQILIKLSVVFFCLFVFQSDSSQEMIESLKAKVELLEGQLAKVSYVHCKM